MTPIPYDPTSKLSLDFQERANTQLLCLEKSSIPDVASEALPLEIWEMVASHLQKQDLENLSKVSKKCKAAALFVKNAQEISSVKNELQVLAILNPAAPSSMTCALDFYKKFLGNLQNRALIRFNRGLEIHPDFLPQLKQRLLVLTTQEIAAEILEVSQECYREMHYNTWCFKCIEEKYLSKKTSFVLKALSYIVFATTDPKLTTERAVRTAAKYGQLEVVQHLLATGAHLNIFNRGKAVMFAAENGHFKIVKALLQNGSITEETKTTAIQHASKQGHYAIADFLRLHQS